MTLNQSVTIGDLLKEYPFLLESLANYRPDFKKLRNPILRNTVGRFATLTQAAAMGEVPVDELLSFLSAEIQKHAGLSSAAAVEPVATPQPPSDPQARREILKGIIRDLHAGKDLEQLKRRFADLVRDLQESEIAQMEQQLIAEGLPVEQVQRLCDVHVKVFKEALDSHGAPQVPAGHPVHTFMKENRELEKILDRLDAALAGPASLGERLPDEARPQLVRLEELTVHYLRKENQLFPFLEKHGITGPSQVMWAVHDEIRGQMKTLRKGVADGTGPAVRTEWGTLGKKIRDMIYKEEKILFPMCLQTLTAAEWIEIAAGEKEIGYAWLKEEDILPSKNAVAESSRAGALPLDTGRLTLDQINLMLNHLPADISFVDENDEVRYYSAGGGERIFPRSPAVIGRKVQNCHPPKSVGTVNKILESFKAGAREVAEFWITKGERLIHIRYFAVRDKQRHYRGTLEVSQDVTGIRNLQGEKRLLDWH